MTRRPPAPPLPAKPFSVEEAAERLGNTMNLFDTSAEAQAELDASGAVLLEDARDILSDRVTDGEFCFAIPFLLQIWFALVPPGCRAPEVPFDDLEKSFTTHLRQAEAANRAGNPKKLEAFVKDCPQPGLMLAVASAILKSAPDFPKEIQPGPAPQLVILALLKTVVQELDQALRHQGSS